jgi:hypothetical protein
MNIRRYFGGEKSSKRKTEEAYGAEELDPSSPVASGGGRSVNGSRGKSYMYLTMGQDNPSDMDNSAEEDEEVFAEIGNKIEENTGSPSVVEVPASTTQASTAQASTAQVAAVDTAQDTPGVDLVQNIWGGILGVFGVSATPAPAAVPTVEVAVGGGAADSEESELDSHKLAEIEHEGKKYVVFDKQNGSIFSMDSKGVVDKEVGVMQNGVPTFNIVI